MQTKLLSRSIAVPGTAGLLATIPMTAAILLLRPFAKSDLRRAPSPHEITSKVMEATPIGEHVRGKIPKKVASTLAHFAFGAAAALPYTYLNNHLRKRKAASSRLFGPLYGVAVWALSYVGFLPRLGLQPRASNQPPARSANMLLSHLVWGVALDKIMSRLTSEKVGTKVGTKVGAKGGAVPKAVENIMGVARRAKRAL